jgi:hypothetical protein
MQILPANPVDALEQIHELMRITKKPRKFKTFKKFRQDRDMKIKGLFQYIHNCRFPTGAKIKRANGRTYEVQSDGSFRRLPEVFEKPWQPKPNNR